MKKVSILALVAAFSLSLAGCLEIDLSRTNGNQKVDEPTEVTE